MLEHYLTNELHRVADAVPVPADLFPAALRLKRAGARRRPWALVAAAAVALVLLGFTPLGQKAVVATTEWVMTHKVKVMTGAPPHDTDLRAIQIGETVEEKGRVAREVHRGVAVADLDGWPLPTYLGPDPAGKAVLTQVYLLEDDNLFSTGLMLDWPVPQLGEHASIAYHLTRGGISPRQLEEIRSGKLNVVELYGLKASQVKQQTVRLKGHEATATLAGTTWMLDWWHEGGSGHLSGNIPLEELLKVAESLPSLE